jgi:serine/threonine protein kinase
VKYVGSTVLSTNPQTHQPIETGFIVTEFYEINLATELTARRFTSTEILSLLRQLTSALEQIHSLGCLHLDLKP